MISYIKAIVQVFVQIYRLERNLNKYAVLQIQGHIEERRTRR